MPKIFLCLSLWLGLTTLCAQDDLFNVDIFSTKDGLIQSQVRSIFEDSHGYIWLGTHRGLSRFDGQHFINFEPGKGKDGKLTGSFVNDILEDHHGHLWIATDRGASRFDGNHFENFQSDSLVKVLSLMEDSTGQIWFGTQDKGLSTFELGKGFNHKPFGWRDDEKNKRTVYDILLDKNHKVFFARANGLFQKPAYDNAKIDHAQGILPQIEPNIFVLMQDSKSRLWIGTDAGLFCRDGEQTIHYSLTEGLPDLSVFALLEDRENAMWAGTAKGLVRLKKGGKDFKAINISSNQKIDYNIRSALVDSENNLWFGTEGGGVLKLSKGVFSVYSINRGMCSNFAKSFLEDDKGQIWISTFDKGISVYNPDNESFVKKFTQEEGLRLPAYDIAYSMEDSKGRFWFASYSKGVFCLDKEKLCARFDAHNGLGANEAYCLAEDGQGRIWVGTKFGAAVIKNGRIVKRYTRKGDGLRDNSVYSICPRKNGEIWIGTAAGLSILRDDHFDNEHEIGNTILTIIEDQNEKLWIASSVGLWYSDGQDFRAFPPIQKGSPGANNIVALALKEDKWLWIGTEAGVHRMDLSQLKSGQDTIFTHFGRSDGIPSQETNANAAFIDSQGWMWFGTTDGAVRCPVNVQKSELNKMPKAVITAVGSLQKFDCKKQKCETGTGLPMGLKIPFIGNRITFDFVGISTTQPTAVRYRHRLTGDANYENWTSPSHHTNTSFNHLQPGAYTFQMQAGYGASNWETAEVAAFQFEILPAFWQTWWFWTLMAALALLAAWLVFRELDARAKRKREETQMKFNSEKLKLEHQALYAMMNPHFTFNALQSIQYFILSEDKLSANKFLSRFAKLVRINLESTRTDFISLGEEIERLDLYLSLEQMRFKGKFTYDVSVSSDIDRAEIMIPPMIFQPFVENSIKHGISSLSDGKIEVKLSRQGKDHLLICIIDNGIGLQASKERQAHRPKKHVSRGMQITKDRLALFAKMNKKEQRIEISEIFYEDDSVAGTKAEILLPIMGAWD